MGVGVGAGKGIMVGNEVGLEVGERDGCSVGRAYGKHQSITHGLGIDSNYIHTSKTSKIKYIGLDLSKVVTQVTTDNVMKVKSYRGCWRGQCRGLQ